MKKHALLLILSIAFGLCSHAQYWERMNSGSTELLHDVFFISPSQGWVVGSNASILATLDGGETWTPQVSPVATSITFRTVVFTSPTKGWIGGTSATLLTTEDGGSTWTSVGTSSSLDHYDMVFTSPDTGYIVGANGGSGYVRRTFNGGLTWASTTMSEPLYAVDFTSNTKGWACGYLGVIFRTTNGLTWTQQVEAGANVLSNLSCIDMVSDTVGWAGGNSGNNRRTVDGGLTWVNQASGTYAGRTGISFSDNQNGWASTTTPLGGGECPAGCPMRYTSDGGSSWTTDTLQGPTLSNVWFYDTSLGWAVGDNGWILRYGNATGNSVAEITPTNTIRVSPNPVSDRLMITSNEPLRSAEVFNSTGSLVLTLNSGGMRDIDVSALPPGSYAVRFSTGNGAVPQVDRFIKE